MKYFVKIITVTLILLGLTACEDRLDIQTNFPFEVKTMPVPKDIQQGQTVEIRCQIVSEQKYKYETYTLRYFQFESNGRLKLANQEPFLPNDTYVIPNRTFRLYYTS
ncbi:TraQ conjugal transfer family protein, partial [Ornithobacterium rhinotracheale]